MAVLACLMIGTAVDFSRDALGMWLRDSRLLRDYVFIIVTEMVFASMFLYVAVKGRQPRWLERRR